MTMGSGRPSIYTPEIAAEICTRLGNGESLRRICEDDHMPGRETVRQWLREDREGFRGRYAHAREDQADHYAEEIVGIVDTDPDPARARVRMDARRWIASKLAPKVYGDKLLAEHSGADGGAIQTETKVTIEIVRAAPTGP